MAIKWNKVEKNIFQSEDDPRKFRVELYFGRDERGKMKKSRKVIEGTLKDARKLLKLHEADLVKGIAKKPTKVTLQYLDKKKGKVVYSVMSTSYKKAYGELQEDEPE